VSDAAAKRRARQTLINLLLSLAWYAGFVGPNSEFIAMTQGFDVNQTWIQIQLEANKPTGEITLGNQSWTIYETTKTNTPAKSKDFLMLLEYQNHAVLVYGVAPKQQLEDFATQLSLLIETN